MNVPTVGHFNWFFFILQRSLYGPANQRWIGSNAKNTTVVATAKVSAILMIRVRSSARCSMSVIRSSGVRMTRLGLLRRPSIRDQLLRGLEPDGGSTPVSAGDSFSTGGGLGSGSAAGAACV